ncbi:MAG TPA: hypothetical protein VIM65_24530 [Cyclobacteriaceae bacterium]
MRKQRLHTATIIMGLITALVVIFSQVFFFEAARYSKKEVKTEKQEKQKNADDSCISLPSFSQPTSAHVEINTKPFCLFEILFEENEQPEVSQSVPLSLGKFFQTLFRVIISPNAP